MAFSPEGNIRRTPELIQEQYDLVDKRPRTIQRQTAFWIDAYLTNQEFLFEGMHEYFDEYTLPFIKDIRQGLGHFERLGKIKDKKYLDSIIAKNVASRLPATANEDEHRAMEAFDFALTNFWHLPDNHTIQIGGNSFGFSLRGNLKPPQTVDEFLWRTYELYSMVNGMVDSSVPTGLNVSEKMALVRPIAFFKTGSTMPLHLPQNHPEKAQGLRIKPLDNKKHLLAPNSLPDTNGGFEKTEEESD